MSRDLYIFGASGHAKVVADVARRMGGWSVAGYVDDDSNRVGEDFFGARVLSRAQLLDRRDTDAELDGVTCAVVAIGSNGVRARIAAWLREQGFELVTPVHPDAVLADGVDIGSGSVVMAGAVVNSGTVIGRDVIINTRAGIDHDCVIADCVHIAPGSTLCGSVRIGEGAFVAAGATVTPNRNVGAGAVIGAGAVVIADVPADRVAVGVPTRLLPD